MKIQHKRRVDADQHDAEDDRAWLATWIQCGVFHRRHEHALPVLHAKLMCFTRTHVNVALRHDDAFGKFQLTGWSHEFHTRRASKVAGITHRRVNAKPVSVAAGNLELGLPARRPHNTNAFDFALGPDDIERFFARKLTLLGNVAQDLQLVAFAVEKFQVALENVQVAVGDSDRDAFLRCGHQLLFLRNSSTTFSTSAADMPEEP